MLTLLQLTGVLFSMRQELVPSDRAGDLPMRSGGISLLRTSAAIGHNRAPIILHLYVVPRGRLTDEKGPVRREEILGGTSIRRSPFYLELFERRSDGLRKLSSAPFEEDGDVHRVEVRWLKPREKQFPVLLLRFGGGTKAIG